MALLLMDGDRYVGRIFRENTSTHKQWFLGRELVLGRWQELRECADAGGRDGGIPDSWDALPPDSTPAPGKPI